MAALICLAPLVATACGSSSHVVTAAAPPSATSTIILVPRATKSSATVAPAGVTQAPAPTNTPPPSATAEPVATAPEPTATASPTPTEPPVVQPTDAAAPEAGAAPLIAIDVGHDASTGGAIGVEYLDTLRTALATRAALEAVGYRVALTRADNDTILYGDPSLMPPNADSMDLSYDEGYAHASQALTIAPDLLLSIHYNGADDPDAAGTTVYYCDNGGPQNATLAGLVRDELVAAFAELGYAPPYVVAAEDAEIGKAYGHLATLGNVYNAPFDFAGNRLDGIPAVLTEALFETNPTERALIEDDATLEALAQAYVRAIDAYFER